MFASNYVSKNIKQSVPPQLSNRTHGSDVIVSRTTRRILPNGNTDQVTSNAELNFNIASQNEWLDAKTAVFHAKIRVPVDDEGAATEFKPNMASLFSGYLLSVKGQTLEDTTTQDQHIVNWLRQRLFRSELPDTKSRQLTMVTDPNQNNALYQRPAVGGFHTYHCAIPLRDIINFYNLSRSYLPIMAIPQNLRLTLNEVQNLFRSPDNHDLTNISQWSMSDIYISADFLLMDSGIDQSFRKMVASSQVSFFYPSFFTLKQTAESTNITAKANLNASNLESMYLYLTKPATGIPDDLYPYNTDVWTPETQASMDGFEFQVFIDSRPCFSQPITNVAELLVALEKSIKNENNAYLLDTPNITAKSFLELPNPAHTEDLPLALFSVPLSRQLETGSMSGSNISLTGGRIQVMLSGLSSVSGRNMYMLFKHTRELTLSADFISVVR